jgi:hypothetical protein
MGNQLLPPSVEEPVVSSVKPVFRRVVREEPGARSGHVYLAVPDGCRALVIILPVRFDIGTRPGAVPRENTVENRVVLEVGVVKKPRRHKVKLTGALAGLRKRDFHRHLLDTRRCGEHSSIPR